jgi:hypothetical protein
MTMGNNQTQHSISGRRRMLQPIKRLHTENVKQIAGPELPRLRLKPHTVPPDVNNLLHPKLQIKK